MRFETVPWAEFFGLVDQVHIRMWSGVSGLLLSNRERDFTARDRLIAEALRPHAASLVRHARGRRVFAALQAAADAAEESDARGFAVVGSGNAIEYASPAAQRLLEAWFGRGFGGRLPARISDWLASKSREQPLRVGGEDFAAFPARGVGLDVVLDNIAEGITAQRADGSLAYANDAAARLLGLTSGDELLGLSGSELMQRFLVIGDDREPLAADDLPNRRAIVSGRAAGGPRRLQAPAGAGRNAGRSSGRRRSSRGDGDRRAS